MEQTSNNICQNCGKVIEENEKVFDSNLCRQCFDKDHCNNCGEELTEINNDPDTNYCHDCFNRE